MSVSVSLQGQPLETQSLLGLLFPLRLPQITFGESMKKAMTDGQLNHHNMEICNNLPRKEVFPLQWWGPGRAIGFIYLITRSLYLWPPFTCAPPPLRPPSSGISSIELPASLSSAPSKNKFVEGSVCISHRSNFLLISRVQEMPSNLSKWQGDWFCFLSFALEAEQAPPLLLPPEPRKGQGEQSTGPISRTKSGRGTKSPLRVESSKHRFMQEQV